MVGTKGATSNIDLIEDGENINVTNDNKYGNIESHRNVLFVLVNRLREPLCKLDDK